MSRVKILRASAGSGKTYRLAYEYIKAVIISPRAYASILAVTFTNKATEEMKSRILAELNSLTQYKSSYLSDLEAATGFSQQQIATNAATARSLILHDYSHFSISTIDKFFQKIVRSFIKELELDFSYTVELNDDGYIGEAVERLISRAAAEPLLAKLTSRVMGENIENARNWDIRPELIRISSEITRERFITSKQDPEKAIALHAEIVAQAAALQKHVIDESLRIIDLLESHGLQPSDFKGGSRSFASLFVKLSSGNTIERIDRLHKVAESAQEWYTKTSPRRQEIAAIVPELMQLTANLVARYEEFEIEQNSLELLTENFSKTLLLAYISNELQLLWAERKRLPLHQTTKLIGRLVDKTAVPFIYEKVGTRFTRYMIDEFQDTSSGQWNNFVPLLDDAIASSDRESVMLIGDVKQAIYRWRGGDWDILARGAVNHFGTNSDATEQLNTNWRSLPVIVEYNNRLLRAIVETQDSKVLSTVYQDFEQTSAPGKSGGYVQVRPIDPVDHQSTLLDTIAHAIARGYRQRDIAVLVRSKKHGQESAEILLAGGYSIIDHESLQLTNSTAVGRIIALLKHALNRLDIVSLAKYNRLSGQELSAPFADITLLDSLLSKTPLEALDTIIIELGLGEKRDQFSYLQAFYQVVLKYSTDNVPDLSEFIAWWDENGYKKSVYLPSSGDAITILTIFKSKGLQYPCVIIPHCEWELEPVRQGSKYTTVWANASEPRYAPFNPAPITYKKEMQNSYYVDDYVREQVYSVIDAVNLLYVAVTRAERELYIFYSSSKGKNSISELMTQAGFGSDEVGQREQFNPSVSENASQTITMSRFAIEPSLQKIRTSWDTQRYYEDGTMIETPINVGVLMHKIFSQIAVIEDAPAAVRRLVISGEISETQSLELLSRITSAVADPRISTWFSPHWRLYNENAIIRPASSSIRRPDRVMINGLDAVVVDYKFGKIHKASHLAQIREYQSLLTDMGYATVTGYVWYVEQGEIVEVC